ncbi:hypothetical protein [Marinobacter gelidimuriae]|uniref:hypothetical protein n=1 Tax=Marinobacter gelidimuriae TaxID=2739064 RepID=UPI0003647876|nr:hypothetical protein [Marinobacter gelidimuriae]
MSQRNVPAYQRAREQSGRELEANWVTGWAPQPLQTGDWVLRVSGDMVLKPANGWLQTVAADEVASLSASAVSLGQFQSRPLFVVNQTDGALAGLEPWPFPHQLMAGFFADYESGELVLQQDELADAGWFVPDHTPPIPPLTTISGQLIHDMSEEILLDIAGRANR